MARVFTILNHGTNSNRTRTDGEIIATFGKAVQGTEYEDFLITDGPGSAPASGAGAMADEAPTPGTFKYWTRDKERKDSWWKRVSRARGMITGKGWEENVGHALAALYTLHDDGKMPDIVNMIGWSRGAVTCLRIAYQMHEIFPAVGVRLPEINVFAIDPVAGLGNKADPQNSTIPPNVDNYLATLAIHEQRKGFKPQSIKRVNVIDPKQSNVVFLPFPGRHDTQVKREGGTTGTAARLVWHLAYKFLAHLGTRIRPEHIPVIPRSTIEIVELYSLLRFNMPDYRELRQHAHWYRPLKDIGARVQGGLGQRDFAKSKMDSYVFEAGYFINEHHRTAFKRVLPNTYFHLFGPKSLVTPKSMLQAEGVKIRGEPATLKTLEKFGYDGKTAFGTAGAGRTRGSLEELHVRGNLVRMGLFA